MENGNGEGAVEPLRERLAKFFEANGQAKFVEGEKGATIERPWGDATVVLSLAGERVDALVDALNNVYFPPRFSALWHKDSSDLEFIWQPFGDFDFKGRTFSFQIEGQTYKCEWAEASARLLEIGRAFVIGPNPGVTLQRNLAPFSVYYAVLKEHPELAEKLSQPLSFWIRAVKWDEDRIVELARHLNFYMHYYDRATPRVSIHETNDGGRAEAFVQHPLGDFPSAIAARRLDSYLLSVWETALATDPFKRFLYGYQVLEFASFYHLDEGTHENIRKIILSPDAPARFNEAVRQIIDAVMQVRLGEPQKLSSVIRHLVEPARLWTTIEANKEILSTSVTFDGGFEVPALTKPKETLDEFKAAGFKAIADHFRNIRNAIVHSREAKQAASIAPTEANREKLRVWATLVLVAAMEIMLYREA